MRETILALTSNFKAYTAVGYRGLTVRFAHIGLLAISHLTFTTGNPNAAQSY